MSETQLSTNMPIEQLQVRDIDETILYTEAYESFVCTVCAMEKLADCEKNAGKKERLEDVIVSLHSLMGKLSIIRVD